MGISTEAYRAHVGLFAATLHPRRRSHRHKHDGNLQGKFELSMNANVSMMLRMYLLRTVGEVLLGASASSPHTARMSIAIARTSVLGSTLYALLLFACALKSTDSPTSKQDFSQRLLFSGDISENPGPDHGEKNMADVSTTPLAVDDTSMKFAQLDARMQSMTDQSEKQMNSLMSMLNDRFDGLHNDMMSTKTSLVQLGNQQEQMRRSIQEIENRSLAYYQHLTEVTNAIMAEQDDIKKQLHYVSNVCLDSVQSTERQLESLELDARRNNIRLFGVPEARVETYFDCLGTVVQLLREAVPGEKWGERDLVRVQRLGPRNQHSSRPRPILVSMASWSDKLLLLQQGRDRLRTKGVKISGDLTTKQASVLREHRKEGRVGYFRNNRLYFRDSSVADPSRGARSHDSTGNSFNRPSSHVGHVNTGQVEHASGQEHASTAVWPGDTTAADWTVHTNKRRRKQRARHVDERNLIYPPGTATEDVGAHHADPVGEVYLDNPATDRETADRTTASEKHGQLPADIVTSIWIPNPPSQEVALGDSDTLPSTEAREQSCTRRAKDCATRAVVCTKQHTAQPGAENSQRVNPRTARPERADSTQRSLLDYFPSNTAGQVATSTSREPEDADLTEEDFEDAVADADAASAALETAAATSATTPGNPVTGGCDGNEHQQWCGRLRSSRSTTGRPHSPPASRSANS